MIFQKPMFALAVFTFLTFATPFSSATQGRCDKFAKKALSARALQDRVYDKLLDLGYSKGVAENIVKYHPQFTWEIYRRMEFRMSLSDYRAARLFRGLKTTPERYIQEFSNSEYLKAGDKYATTVEWEALGWADTSSARLNARSPYYLVVIEFEVPKLWNDGHMADVVVLNTYDLTDDRIFMAGFHWLKKEDRPAHYHDDKEKRAAAKRLERNTYSQAVRKRLLEPLKKAVPWDERQLEILKIFEDPPEELSLRTLTEVLKSKKLLCPPQRSCLFDDEGDVERELWKMKEFWKAKTDTSMFGEDIMIRDAKMTLNKKYIKEVRALIGD